MRYVKIGNVEVGDGFKPCFCAEGGINGNGALAVIFMLIDAAVDAGCEFFKLQTRTLDVVFTAAELAAKRITPFGDATNGQWKARLELTDDDYRLVAAYCNERGINFISSCWDEASVDRVERLIDPVCYKIASASITDIKLLKHHRRMGKPLIMSVGGSTVEQVKRAVGEIGTDDLVLLHAFSAYPAPFSKINLRAIMTLRKLFPNMPIGYSGHENPHDDPDAASVAAVAIGACFIERHITMSRTMFGSDQKLSLLPLELAALVRKSRLVHEALGTGTISPGPEELATMDKLRRVK